MSYLGVPIIVALWLVWIAPFVFRRVQIGRRPAVRKAPASRWGIVLQAISFAVVWYHAPGPAEAWLYMPAWRIVAEIVFGIAGTALGTAGLLRLGKQWRLEAGLIADHELVQTGPYAIVRHPIYASLLAMMLATGFAVAGWPQFAAAVALYVIGLEIRIRAEERLLAERFGEKFEAYRARVPAYLPFVR